MSIYSRQEILLGKEESDKLRNKTVTVIGLGGLGSIAVEYLARSGIKVIGIDRDTVEESNLNRQLYSKDDIGKPKTIALKEKLEKEGLDLEIKTIDVNQDSVKTLNSDIVLDCTDNMKTRFLLNDYCHKNKIPLIYGGGIKEEGMVAVISGSPCLRCLFPEPDPGSLDTCETSGVLNTVTGVVGLIQVTEAVHLLLEREKDYNLIQIDFKDMNFSNLNFEKRENCKTCKGDYKYLNREEKDVNELCSAIQIKNRNFSTPLSNLSNRIENLPEVSIIYESDEALTLSYNDIELTILRDGSSIVKNTTTEKAKSIISKIISN